LNRPRKRIGCAEDGQRFLRIMACSSSGYRILHPPRYRPKRLGCRGLVPWPRGALGVHGVERSRGMGSSQTTGGARPDDRQIGNFPCQNIGFGRSSAILRSRGVLRDGSALSKTPNSRTLATKLEPIRGIPVKTDLPKRMGLRRKTLSRSTR
jgi:hypothetical protein